MKRLLLAAALVLAGCQDKPCDLDRDGKQSTLADYSAFYETLGLAEGDVGYNKRADLDGDHAVTSEDFTLFRADCPMKEEDAK